MGPYGHNLCRDDGLGVVSRSRELQEKLVKLLQYDDVTSYFDKIFSPNRKLAVGIMRKLRKLGKIREELVKLRHHTPMTSYFDEFLFLAPKL